MNGEPVQGLIKRQFDLIPARRGIGWPGLRRAALRPFPDNGRVHGAIAVLQCELKNWQS